ncbi:nitrate reductase molybdenum cofactor assembly chaperone [Actinomycetospora straminea]|uniref:Nitrate reductase molybdenum cofactor assembly chaperone n=1 Tax=Actinomycetospora straminea TaxID=663607 RepID=A0ABP9EJ50_9PSEU|nr:nitrate reductase molybdenum cofactor assembly chaperone [Actinomycetospora straminea]MDD7933200.1 nitrate reductase molybdenum cofactor assembly chaperone [Actinomycetospora straminea]
MSALTRGRPTAPTLALDEQAHATLLQAASVCLRYPDRDVLDLLPLIRTSVRAVPESPARAHLLVFLDALAPRTPDELAELYVAVFDRRRRCCLDLTWWTDGETRRRGASLAALKERYRAAGVEFSGTELPDHLPAVLEYAALGHLADGLALLQEHRAGLELLRLALHDADAPWAAVLQAVCALLPGPSPTDVAAAKALARSGPPHEQVGLDLAPFGVGDRR